MNAVLLIDKDAETELSEDLKRNILGLFKSTSAYRAIALDIENSGIRKMENFYIKPVLPEPIILMIKAQFEKKMNVQPVGK